MPHRTAPRPVVDADGVSLVLPDRAGRLAGVRLLDEVGLGHPPLTRTARGWAVHVPRPAVDRIEYLFEVVDHNGNRTTITDPGNPASVGGAFGAKSVVEFPGYRAPSWLDRRQVDAVTSVVEIEAPVLDGPLVGLLWRPRPLAADEPAPLVVVHDGPEYDRLGGCTAFLAAAVADGTVPPVRALLLDPGDRTRWYAANDAYADALAAALTGGLPPTTARIGVGVSLGALAMLHAHCRHGVLDAMLLQSGSFFTAELDPQESEFAGFAAVTAFVAGVAGRDARPVPTILTCGGVEENLANNRAMLRTLIAAGYPAALRIRRDAHNFTAWRDALDPALTELITSVAVDRAA